MNNEVPDQTPQCGQDLHNLHKIFSDSKKYCVNKPHTLKITNRIFLPILRGAGKFCLAHGLGQLTRDVASDARTLNF